MHVDNYINTLHCPAMVELLTFLFCLFSHKCRSPDGSCVLSCSNDNKLRLFNLPQSVLQPHQTDQTSDTGSEMVGILRIPLLYLLYCSLLGAASKVVLYMLLYCMQHTQHV